jgi:molecular chaperone GrpE (heat shock protein)
MNRAEMENWNKRMDRSAEKKRIAAHHAAIRPFLRPVQRLGSAELDTSEVKRNITVIRVAY